MASPAGTTTGAGADAAAGATAYEPGRPSWLMIMPLRAAEQHVLVVVGEADLHTAGQLRSQLIDMLWTGAPSLLVELGALEFCDLSGLDALHDAARAAHDAGVALTFGGMSPQLAWLHATFPHRNPVPPATPGTALRTPVPTDPGRPARDPAARPTQHGPTGHVAGQHRAGPRPGSDPWAVFLTARGGGRRGAPDQSLHLSRPATTPAAPSAERGCGRPTCPGPAPPRRPARTARPRCSRPPPAPSTPSPRRGTRPTGGLARQRRPCGSPSDSRTGRQVSRRSRGGTGRLPRRHG